jgi:predicted 3-demethylubiquinone-9 3-methyltransferase (glyoxalase superfamily)
VLSAFVLKSSFGIAQKTANVQGCNDAENHSIPVVRQQRRRGDELLSVRFQKLEALAGIALWRCRTRPEGSFMVGSFSLEGQEFMVLNGGPHYKLTPAFSLMVNCETQEEVDYYWDKLTDGGTEVQCGWLTDKFGVSWQVVPKVFMELMRKGNAEQTNRMIQALYNMKKLIIADLQKAYDG